MAGLLYCVRCDTPLMQHEPLHICPRLWSGISDGERKRLLISLQTLTGGTAAKELSKEMIERRPMPI